MATTAQPSIGHLTYIDHGSVQAESAWRSTAPGSAAMVDTLKECVEDSYAMDLTDADLRGAMRSRLKPKVKGTHDAVLIEELGILRGQVRIDLALVNGKIHGFELKSSRDTLRRLEGQSEAYSAVLDSATLVTTEHHFPSALGVVPQWWGVVLAQRNRRGSVVLHSVRAAQANPTVRVRALAELIWYDDAVAMLRARQATRGILGKPRAAVWDRLCETVPAQEIHAAVRAALKARSRARSAPPPA